MVQASKVLLPSQRTFRQRILSFPMLAVLCWLCLQKGCIWNPDISPANAAVGAHTPVISEQEWAVAGWEDLVSPRNLPILMPLTVPHDGQAVTNQSLRQASGLLREAAALLDRNDRGAIRLILQAITILKQEIIDNTQGLEQGRISLSPPPAPYNQFAQDVSTPRSSFHPPTQEVTAARPLQPNCFGEVGRSCG